MLAVLDGQPQNPVEASCAATDNSACVLSWYRTSLQCPVYHYKSCMRSTLHASAVAWRVRTRVRDFAQFLHRIDRREECRLQTFTVNSRIRGPHALCLNAVLMYPYMGLHATRPLPSTAQPTVVYSRIKVCHNALIKGSERRIYIRITLVRPRHGFHYHHFPVRGTIQYT